MTAAAALYVVALTLYFLVGREQQVSKSLRFFLVAAAWSKAPIECFKRGMERADRVAVLSTLLKSFFGPMMVMSLMIFCIGAWTNGSAILTPVWTGWACCSCSTASASGSCCS